MEHEIQNDEHLNVLTNYIINGWKMDVKQDIQPYQIFHDDLAVTDR